MTEARLSQSRKQLFDMVSRLGGSSMLTSASQLLNTSLPKFFNPSGRIISARSVLSIKMRLPIYESPAHADRSALVRAEQPEKAPSPTVVTAAGTSRPVREVPVREEHPSKALLLIVSRESGSVTVFSAVHPLKALEPMTSSPAGSSTVSSEVQFSKQYRCRSPPAMTAD